VHALDQVSRQARRQFTRARSGASDIDAADRATLAQNHGATRQAAQVSGVTDENPRQGPDFAIPRPPAHCAMTFRWRVLGSVIGKKKAGSADGVGLIPVRAVQAYMFLSAFFTSS
jgi:hypothetical protein